jgi:hypothetical protein
VTVNRIAASSVTLILMNVGPLYAWGLAAHQAVTAEAIESLPGGLKGFYKDHSKEMPTLGIEPDLPPEGPDRRFAVDTLLPYPFSDLPHKEAAIKERYGDAAEHIGRLPWLIQEGYGRLVQAFKAGDRTEILNASDDLAGLVADLHNPLAVTENADGQKSGQHGLWVRFTEKLPEVLAGHGGLKLSSDAARYLDDPNEYVFSMVNASYIWVDNILYGEELARRGKAGYTEIYYESLERRVRRRVQELLSLAAEDAGSYWYTAWTDAGRPKLK